MKSRSWKLIVGVVVVFVTVTAALAAQAQNAREVFERARLLEESASHVGEAIKLYQQVVTGAGADRTLAATAQLRIGQAYEKQGKREAVRAYGMVVREFADQPAVVAQARARLAALSRSSQAGTSSPRLLFSSKDLSGIADVSADGQLGFGQAWSPRFPGVRDLVAVDMLTGNSTVIVAGSQQSSAYGGVISPDGKWAAYLWEEGRPVTASSLRIVRLEVGSTPRSLLSREGRGNFFPAGWSPDGKHILVQRGAQADSAAPDDRAPRLAWVSVTDGTTQTIKTFRDFRSPGGARLSPDGTRIAFVAAPRPGATERHIFVADVATGSDRAVVKIAGQNNQPFWSPDGSKLFFTGDRTGTLALYSVDVAPDGGASEPELVQTGFRGGVIKLTARGDMYINRLEGAARQFFVADRTTPGAPPTHVFGSGNTPTLSKDGRSVAFYRFASPGNELTVRSLVSGEERRYPRTGLDVIPALWTRDGRTLIIYAPPAADDNSLSGAFYSVDLASGVFRRLFSRNSSEFVRNNTAILSHDDKTLYTLARPAAQADGGWTTIVGIDLGTGTQAQLGTLSTPIRSGTPLGLALSPDGASLVIGSIVPENGRLVGRLYTVRLDGTSLRELHGPFPVGSSPPFTPAWTADGRDIIFGALNLTGTWQTFRIASTGGSPQPDGVDFGELSRTFNSLVLDGGGGISLSADGLRVAVVGGMRSVLELWQFDLRGALSQRRHP